MYGILCLFCEGMFEDCCSADTDRFNSASLVLGSLALELTVWGPVFGMMLDSLVRWWSSPLMHCCDFSLMETIEHEDFLIDYYLGSRLGVVRCPSPPP